MKATSPEENNNMCATCGCGIPDDKHGDPRHITLGELEAAAKAADTDLTGVLNNIHEMISQASTEAGTTGEQAR
jgi:hypothetical protein